MGAAEPLAGPRVVADGPALDLQDQKPVGRVGDHEIRLAGPGALVRLPQQPAHGMEDHEFVGELLPED